MRDTAGPYKLLDRIGGDAIGETWRARDTERGRTAFVRLVDARIASDPAKRAALIADAKKAAGVSHPAVAALYDVVDDGAEGVALAHEHVEGRTVAGTLGGSAINPRMAVAIGIQVADGLAELHAAGMTHGAVDGAHVMITTRGQAKLLDAGLTQWLSASPESDDLAALGAMLSSMMGTLPPEPWAAGARQALERTRTNHPRRYQTMAVFAAELRGISAMLEARADALPPASTSSVRSVLLWALLALVLLALGVWFLLL